MNARDAAIGDLPPVVIAALAAYEQSVQFALRIAPTHWQRYRDPFEIDQAIKDARALGRVAMEEVERVVG